MSLACASVRECPVTSGHDSGLSSPRSLLLRRFKAAAHPLDRRDEIDEAFLTHRRGSTFGSTGVARRAYRSLPVRLSRMQGAELVSRGREAFAQRAWADAFESLSRADQAAPVGAEELELLATSAYMLGRDDDYVACARACPSRASRRRRYAAGRALRVLDRSQHAVPRESGPRDGMVRARRAACSNARSETASSAAIC